MSLFRMAKTALKNLASKPATQMYPAKPARKFKSTRGRVENDMDKCILCGLCQRKCPCVAIRVDRDERTWEIDRFRCVTCGCCVEVCPVKSLRMENDYTKSTTEPKMKDSYKSTNPNIPGLKPAPQKKAKA
ncbi:MAG: 4Fe-4S binding protein [Candidatus ainarchaeum sp.]|nr:4Fe-4S binding protein [Candidatus ainarchaeum sp.]